MTERTGEQGLTRRERQIMDVIWQLGDASVEDVRLALPDPPSYSTIRTLLARLERKGHVVHREQDLRYRYSPAVSKTTARRSAMRRLADVFFQGSVADAVVNMVGTNRRDLSDEELDQIEQAVRAARRERTTS
jgi:BlaI family transcriptional regulator, penicillinase repressor